jgi:hypothetical protein
MTFSKWFAMIIQIPSPPFEVDHKARFKGWNFDLRWEDERPEWNGTHYDFVTAENRVAKPGQRPIVAFVGGKGGETAVQFVESNSEIVGKFHGVIFSSAMFFKI